MDRRFHAEAVGRLERNYHSLVDQFPIWHLSLHTGGKTADGEPCSVRMLGYNSEAELLDQTRRGISMSTRPSARNVAAVLKDGSGFLDSEALWKRKDGRQITVRANGRGHPGQSKRGGML